ncbi:MAG: tetratricopeptide repeat protein [Gallionellaceae bacterium]
MKVREKLLNYFREHDRGLVLSLLVSVGVVYLPFLGNSFVFDDNHFFAGGVAAHYFDSRFYFDLRWLPYASLAWMAAVFGDVAPHLFHFGNMLLHTANVILLFYFLRQLMRAVLHEHEDRIDILWGAWLGALVFAIHPVAVYAVGYVIQRSILMATFFGLLMFSTYLRGAMSGEKRWLLMSVAAYFAACFSKEHSALLPLDLAAFVLLLRDKSKLEKSTLWQVWSAYVLIFVLIVLRAKGVIGSPYEPMAAFLFEQQHIDIATNTYILHLLSVMTQAGLFFKYLFLWLAPNPMWMSIDMREPFVATWTSWQGWLGISAFFAYGVIAIRLLLRGGSKGLLGFALLYPWLLYIIEFSSIRVQEPFVLYRSYLWMPGLMLLFPLLIIKLHGRKMFLLMSLVVVLLIPLAWNRMWIFSNDYRLWNDAALLLSSETVAGADRIYYNRGQAERVLGRWQEAAHDFERAAKISPQIDSIQFELGLAYAHLNRHLEAIDAYDKSIAIKPDEAKYYFFKSVSLMGLHQKAAAREQLQKSCKMNFSLACSFAHATSPK